MSESVLPGLRAPPGETNRPTGDPQRHT